MSNRTLPRRPLTALLSIGLVSLAACQPRDSAPATNADTPTPALADSAGTATTPPAPPTAPAAGTSAQASPAPGGTSPSLKGLDPAPPLSRTAMGNGLVIEELRIGTGEIVWPGARVRTNLRGWSVATGEVYWDTATQGGPKEIALGKSMKGIKEGVPGMRIGGKRRLTIPADMAYGFKSAKNEKGEVVVAQGTPIMLEIEVTEVLAGIKTPTATEAAPAGQPAPPEPAPK